MPTNKENPEINLIEKQNVEHLTKLIDKNLSSFEKQVLNLYINGQSYQQIAENLESNKKSVDNALNRIRTKLLHQLDDTAK
ncbi:MAG: hypothetical protein IJX26_01910 [Clostridia bacterium]|nr:hypothetical protein [Clostridia bacterium]